ncbi:hypothetical protein cand_036180 [Cryptosporidium andersoni]|uniref:Uncharacterized protein n=1 Tax=Cryptosporidium andersoni TaxID=117008 RepID=A0A1J4MVC4_9CRYT|nr:hypothetical protein cand_036180 [Cryptosporidium andersoni]
MIIWDIIYWLCLPILCFSNVYCEDFTTKYTATPDSADTQSNIGQLASLLIVYDVDHVLLCKLGNFKTTINPESVPLLAALDERRKLFDKRILPPTIFSHGCGTVAKFMSGMGNKGNIMETTTLNKQGNVFPFEIRIANMGTAYLMNDIYFLRSFDNDGDTDSPLDILKVFFCDEDEMESNISSDIPLNRVLERRYLYSDIVSKVLTKQELPIFQDFMKKTTKDQRIIVSRDTLPSTNYSQGREYVKKILAKISSLARDWPYAMRSSEVLEVKDMVKYRNYMKDKINLGTTVVLIDDYLYHLNFACMNEHISDKYKILVILVRRFFNKGIPHLESKETQKSIPVPIGTLPYEPFRLREVQSKLLHMLDIIPPTASPLTFYKALRDEFMFKEPTSPKCGYDVTNPSPFYILIVMDCDMLSHILKLFIDDRMADEILLLLNIITYISVITNNKSCESSCDSSFTMVRHLITSGVYEWTNKIFPLPPIIGYSKRDTDNLFTDKISDSSQSSSSSKESTNFSRILDKHIFMAKFHTRLPRTRTLVLRLDFNGNLSNLQHTDYTCFLNAPTTPSDDIPAYPSKSDKIKQRLNLQFDMKLYKSLVTSSNGEVKAIILLHKIVNVLKGIDEILESTRSSSAKTTFLERSTSPTYSSPSVVPVGESEALMSTGTVEDISFIQILNSKKFTPIHEAPPTIYPPATYTFLSLFYTLIELLKNEFNSDQMFCIGSVNNYIAM